MNGINFGVLKALVEFMYCGECVFADDMLKHFIATVRFFKISVLEAIFAEKEYQSLSGKLRFSFLSKIILIANAANYFLVYLVI